MNNASIKKYATPVISDVLSCFGVPTSTAMQIYEDMLAKRTEEANEILLSEIRQGRFDGVNQNEAVSIIARYQRDAMEGVAKNNLRLMARMIKGMSEKQELSAPSFSRYANILASLTDKEIRILAVMAQFSDEVASNWGDVVKVRLVKDKRHNDLVKITKQAEGHLQAMMRTGLVNLKLDNISDLDDSTRKYDLTKLMDEILRYVQVLPEFGEE